MLFIIINYKAYIFNFMKIFKMPELSIYYYYIYHYACSVAAILLLMPKSDVLAFLQASQQLGMTTGTYCFIHLDNMSPLQTVSNGTISPSQYLGQDSNTTLQDAWRGFMILKAHAQSLTKQIISEQVHYI